MFWESILIFIYKKDAMLVWDDTSMDKIEEIK